MIYLKQTMLLGLQCCSFSVRTICATLVSFPTINVLYLYVSTSRSLCAVSSMAVFRSPLILRFPGTLLRYCLNDFGMVSVAPVFTSFLLLLVLRGREIYCSDLCVLLVKIDLETLSGVGK